MLTWSCCHYRSLIYLWFTAVSSMPLSVKLEHTEIAMKYWGKMGVVSHKSIPACLLGILLTMVFLWEESEEVGHASRACRTSSQ